MRSSIFFSLLLLMVCSAPTRGLSTVYADDGHVSFPPLPKEYRDKFFESMYEDLVLVGHPGVRKVFSDPADQEAWEGNSPTLIAQIPRVILRFYRPRAQKAAEEGEHFTFDIIVDYYRDSVVVRTTHPASSKQASGFRFPLGAENQWKIFVPGEGDTGMAVLMPQVALRGQYIRALAICPRKMFTLKKGRQGVEKSFIDSGYRLLRVLFHAKGEASGNTVSAGGIGFAKATILTSPNIPRSKEYLDRAYMRDPRIKIKYIPLATEQLSEASGDNPVMAGIQSSVEFHRPSGHRRVSTAREVAWIEEFQLEKEHPWYIKRKKENIGVAPGSCFAVFKERTVEHKFSKEPLELPDRLQ